MKTLKLSFIAALLLAAVSCSKNGGGELTDMIPSNSLVVASINLPEIVKNSGVVTNDNHEIVLPDDVKALIDEEDVTEINEALKELWELGIDETQRAFAFVENTIDDKNARFVALANLKDGNKTIEYFEKKSGKKMEDQEGFKVILDSESNLFVKDNLLMIIAAEDFEGQKVVEYAKKVYEHDFDPISKNDVAWECLERKNDFNAYINFEALLAMTPQMEQNPIIDMLKDLKAFTLDGTLTDNTMKLKTTVVAPKDCDLFKLQESLMADANANFLSVMPEVGEEGINLMFSYSFNGDGLAELSMVKQALAFSRMDDDAPDVEALIRSFKGPIAVGANLNLTDPLVSTAVITAQTTKANDMIQMIGQLLSQEGSLREVSGGYEMTANDVTVRVIADGDMLIGSINPKPNTSNSDESLQSIYSSSKSAGTARINVGGMKLFGNIKMVSVSESIADLYIVGEDGKKLPYISWVKFFNVLGDKLDENTIVQDVLSSSNPIYTPEDDAAAEEAIEAFMEGNDF